MRIFQKGFNFSQDGPGNRLVIHLQGCNLRCPWCANPEGLEVQGTICVDPQWLTPELCAHGAVQEKDGHYVLERSVCRFCQDRECITRKRSKGIYFSCKEYTPDEVVKEIEKSRMMFYDGGGVTFTGGECTMQFEELKQVLTEVHDRGINTAIETNGMHVRLPELFPVIDELIMDCKSTDDEKHKAVIGAGNEVIQANLRAAAKQHPSVHIRVPLIGGFNNSPEDIENFINFFKEISGSNVSFEVLRYHEYGKKKWSECGWTYPMTAKARVSKEEVRAFEMKIREAGLQYENT